jgi:hypothetical protein
VSAIDDIEALALRHEEAGKTSPEDADIALVLRAGIADMRKLDPAAAQDYAHRLKFALWARLDDSPELGDDYSEAHP